MSTTPDPDLNLELHFLPSWAKQPAQDDRYARHEGGGGERPDDRQRRGRRPEGDRRPGGRGERRGPRPGGRPEGGRDTRDDRRPGRDRRHEDRRGPRPVPERLPDVNVNLIPAAHGVESLARQIKLTGRCYPLFEIAALVVQKPERFQVEFSLLRKDGKILQSLARCTVDDTLWLSKEEAVAHALARHFDRFYQAERTPTDPPKGNFTHVATCGMSGVLLGPPNYHGYQAALTRLYNERFSRMPFEMFKSRIKTVKDEALVKQWIEELSFRTEYVCLNVPEPVRLPDRESAARHFHEHHAAGVVEIVEKHAVPGPMALNLPCRPLRELARRNVDEQRKFPIKVVHVLSQQFAALGLQFFKKDKTITHVAVARPHFLDVAATPVSDGIQRILDFINATPNCTRVKLLEALAPALTAPPAAPAPAEGGTPSAGPAAPPPNEAAAAVIADLHWLIHQGHVLEFANGVMETAKRPNPKPQKPGAAREPGYLPVFLGQTPLPVGA